MVISQPLTFYFNFPNDIFAVDERCDMELDETDPTIWLRLEAATQDYIQSNSKSFKSLCDKLLENSHEDKLIESQKFQQYIKAKSSKPCNYLLPYISLYINDSFFSANSAWISSIFSVCSSR